jgi:hypothetical protein
MKLINRLWIFILVLVILSPLGLIMPEFLKSGSAWGEWGIDEIQSLIGYSPEGLKRSLAIWNPPIPDYAFKGWEKAGLDRLSLAYLFSAAVGVLAVIIFTFLVGKLLTKKSG